MNRLATDLRFAVRGLSKQPGLTLIAILAFALGIGLTTTVFSIVHGALGELPFDRPEEIVALSRTDLKQGFDGMDVPIHELVDWRERLKSYQGLAAYYGGTTNLSFDGETPERYEGAFVSANTFELLKVSPILGRSFAPGEDQPGAEPVVLLGYDLWQNRFGGEPGILGKAVRVNGVERTVIGVMPAGFLFPEQQQMWLGLPHDLAVLKRGEGTWVNVFGRLRPGVSIEQAQAELTGVAQQLASEYPESNQNIGALVEPFAQRFIGKEPRLMLTIMLGAVIGVLAIACANVANLLLARAVIRSKEAAIRSAMGAGRRQVMQQMVAEAFVLAAVGALLGVALASLGIDAFNKAIEVSEPPFWIDIRLNGSVLFFAFAMTLLSSLLAGAIPAFQASGQRVNEILKDESRGSSSLRLGRLSRALVVAEIAVSCVLMVLTGLMVKSVVQLNDANFGVDQQHVFSARVALFQKDYPDVESRLRFLEEAQRRLAALPGVKAAAITDSLPVSGSNRDRFRLEGQQYASEQDEPYAAQAVVSPGLFTALGSQLLAGRDFDASDRADSVPVVIVNEPFARKYFPNESPIGKRLALRSSETRPTDRWATIVGMAPDLWMSGNDHRDPEGFYLPLAQSDRSFMSLVARVEGDPMALTRPVQAMVSSIDPNQPIYFVRSLDQSIARSTWFYSVFGTLFMIFGAAALFLASVGLYGVMAFSVSRRTQEVGIRMALGAQGSKVLRMILRQGAWQVGTGLAIGMVIAPLLSQGLAFAFFEVSPHDPVIFLGIAAVLALVGLTASLVPALRASRVSPIVALGAN